jgi:O-antigen ligase
MAGMALQLVPLSAPVRAYVTPGAAAYDRGMRVGSPPAASRPISIEPRRTALALVDTAAIVALFWSLRTLFRHGSVRVTTRAVAWLGLLVSPLAIVHHLVPLPLVDQVWPVTPRGLRPYGPFVNRNDFAGWLIMAVPLTLGYALARVESRQGARDRGAPADTMSIWLGLAIAMMVAGLAFSMSRSGLLGAGAALIVFAFGARRRLTAQHGVWLTAGLAAALVATIVFAEAQPLARRVGVSVSEGLAGRVAIWQQTLPVVRDFWPVGSGAGTYQLVMVPYQTMSKFFYISHADNELLQIAAEGGLLLAAPVLAAAAAWGALAVRRVRTDATAIFWIRLGAAAAVVAAAAQNMVEMTLRVPANAVLFAIVAAVAVHRGPDA